MPTVIVRTPWSRRRVLGWSAGLAGAAGVLKLAVRQAANPSPGGDLRDDAPPPALPTPTRALAVALPATSNWLRTYHDELVTDALRRAQPDVHAAAAGAYTTQFVDVDLGDPPKDMTVAMAPLMASGAPPDVALFTGTWNIGAPQPEFASAVSSRYLQPLDDYLRHDRTLTLSDFYPPAVALSRHRGQLLGIPIQSVPMLLIYDRPRLREAGIPEPTQPWSWAQLADAATRLTRKNGDDGIAGDYGFFSTTAAGALLSCIWENGGEVVSADQRTARLAEPAALDALEFYASFYRDQPRRALSAGPGWSWLWGPEGMVVNGAAWLATCYQSLGAFRDVRGGALAAAELPAGKTRAAATGVRATLGLLSRSRFPDAAAAALFAFADAATQAVQLPARRRSAAAVEALDPHAKPPMDAPLVHQVAVAVTRTLEYGRALVLDDLHWTAQVHGVLSSLVATLQSGVGSVADAADAANRQIQSLLGRP